MCNRQSEIMGLNQAKTSIFKQKMYYLQVEKYQKQKTYKLAKRN